MKRRKFILSSLATSLSAKTFAQNIGQAKKRDDNKLLSAYYFRAHMYTLVPKHVKEDMAWMADHGTDNICVPILEQDLFAAVENVEIIANEAAKRNMQLLMVPSRWAGLVAGAPKVPSTFAVHHPHTWMLHKDGKTMFNNVSGVTCSIFYPEVTEFFKSSVEKAIDLWDVKGVIWDEPKAYNKIDHSPKAIETVGKNAEASEYNQAFTDFWSNINQYLKGKYPELSIHLFVYAHMNNEIVQSASSIKDLDYFGCDGRPWGPNDEGENEGNGKDGLTKTLLGAGERFLSEAKKHNKKSLWLIENHNMRDQDVAIMEKQLPQVLKHNVNHLIYYYYPRNLQNPEKNMSTLAKHISKYR